MIPVRTPERALPPVVKTFLAALENSDFRGEIRPDYPARLLAATDNSVYQVMPQAVVYPRCAADLNVLARLAADAAHAGITFAPRGGGTGTNGQSLNTGIVVDTSKYMNAILDFDEEKRTVTVEPGVVLDQLNSFLRAKGYFFPPMVSTSSRATLGGMVGTDASGQGSRVYGKVSDYIEEMDVVLFGGATWTSKPLSPAALQDVMQRDDIVGNIHRQAYESINTNQDEIARTFPKMNRGLTGYNLQHALASDGTFNLSYLLAGSEGSLCFTQKLTFRFIPVPQKKGLVCVRYARFNDALEGVQLILQAEPESVEVIDDKILSMAQQDIIWTQVAPLLGGDGNEPPIMGMNFVQFVGETDEEIAQQCTKLVDILQNAAGQPGQAVGWKYAETTDQIAALWELRKKAVGLLGALQGKRRALPFVEDTAVPPENLAAYIREFRQLLDRHKVDYGMFGHADVGCLHVRPTLDMTEQADEDKLREISDGVADLTLKYGGLLWGEHGKGFRGEYSPKFFGATLYAELRKIKAAFDPKNIFNPGKIATPYTMPEITLTAIDAAPMRGQYDRQINADFKSLYAKATHCNGNGQCFNWDLADPMCPSYKYTRDRVQSPKGRAGMLREWIRLQSQENPQIHNAIEAPDNDKDFAKDVYESLSTCLSCKACASQCPIKVDIPEMKAEFLYSYHTRYARPRRDKLMPYLEKVLPLMAKAPKFFNGMQKTSMARGASKALFNVVDLPDLSPVSLQKGLKQRKAPHWDVAALAMLPVQEKEKSVVLVQDTFTTYYDAEIVLAHYDLLQKLGYTVYVTPYRPNGKPLHVKGFLAQFDRLAAANDAFYAEVAATGVDMVGIEAAVTLMFRQEYNQRLENRPRYTIYQFQEWLAAQLSKGVVSPPVLAAPAQAYRLFSHCTEKTAIPASPALWGQIFKAFAIDLVPEKTGCCGMSGMFGHEAEHQEMSRGLFEMSWKDKVEAAGADRMLATGFSCRCQTKRFADFKPKHPVQALLAACMP